MSYNVTSNETIMVKSEILGLKDMNPALQGLLLKLTSNQCLVQSNYRVSQKKWEERCKELNETTIDLMLNHIIEYERAQKKQERIYYSSSALGILSDSMNFSQAHIEKMIESGLLSRLMDKKLVTMKSLNEETRKKTLRGLVDDAAESYRGKKKDIGYGEGSLEGYESIVTGITMELYEYLREYAIEVRGKVRSKEAGQEFQERVINTDIEGNILNQRECPLDIVEKYGEPLMRELLLRLRTQSTLSCTKLPIGTFKTDWNSAHEKVVAFVKDIMQYNACPVDYLRKIITSSDLKDEEDLQEQLLDLDREDARLLQLQLLLLDAGTFKANYNRCYHGREVFWARFMQLLSGKPEFTEAFRTAMLDAGTLNLPPYKGEVSNDA